ncbi:MAG: DUF1080 domain-containing protein [Rhodothermales bacterium]
MKTVYLLIILLLLTLPAAGQDDSFRPLFDGQTLAGWEGNPTYFRVENGVLISGRLDADIPHNNFLCTTEEFDNFDLRLDVRMNGRRNNGGIQIRTERIPLHYEVSGYQADIGEWPPEDTKFVWGAMYDETRRNTYLSPAREDIPDFVHITDWNDYRVLADGPRIQIWVNGVLTTDYTETQAVPGKGRICAQIHGGPAAEVWHKNIRIKELSYPLFDGKTLAGWEGNPDYFRVEDGSIVAGRLDRAIPNNEFLCTTKEYGDFELTLQAKMRGNVNNGGIQFRTKRIPNHHEVSGYQADIGAVGTNEKPVPVWGSLYDESRRDRYLVPAVPDIASFSSMTEWNDYRLVAKGSRIQIWINGRQTTDFTEVSHVDDSGVICVQIHGGQAAEVWHRNLAIRVLR